MSDIDARPEMTTKEKEEFLQDTRDCFQALNEGLKGLEKDNKQRDLGALLCALLMQVKEVSRQFYETGGTIAMVKDINQVATEIHNGFVEVEKSKEELK